MSLCICLVWDRIDIGSYPSIVDGVMILFSWLGFYIQKLSSGFLALPCQKGKRYKKCCIFKELIVFIWIECWSRTIANFLLSSIFCQCAELVLLLNLSRSELNHQFSMRTMHCWPLRIFICNLENICKL